MNETLSRLFSKARKTGGAIAYGAGQQAAMLTDRACRGARMVRLKASVHSQLRTVGQMLYDTHAGHPADSEELLDQLRRIDTLNDEIARCRSPAVPHLRRRRPSRRPLLPSVRPEAVNNAA